MSLLRYVLARFPERWQKKITVRLMTSGKIFTTPIWKMLFQTLAFYGGDAGKIRETLVRRHEGVESVISDLCELGRKTRQEADQLASHPERGDLDVVRDMYLEAALYYFMGYFFIHDQDESRKIFADAAPLFDEFRRRMDPPAEKWDFELRSGRFFAHAYYPRGEGPFPAVLAYPGNEGIKEHMATYAKHALRRGIALISIDPPGWGESGLSGCRFSRIEDYGLCTERVYERVASDPRLDEERLATFGVSGGSLTAVIVAGFHDFVVAAAGIGAPDYKNLAKVWKNALGEQKRKTYTWTGLSTQSEAVAFLEKYAADTAETLPNVECPVLLIHGAEDLITKPDSGREIAELIGAHATYRVVPGDDHLCSNTIGSGLADELFDWFAHQLHRERRSRDPS